MKLFGIKFAPLVIPLRRRFQTFSVCFFIFLVFFLLLAPIFLVYLLFTKFFWVPLLYAVWYYYDFQTPEQGGRHVKWFIKLMEIPGRYMADYFPVTLVKTAELPADRNYIFVGHPHGILSIPYVLAFAMDCVGFSRAFPGISANLVSLSPNYYIPMSRDICLLFKLVSCSRQSIDYILGGQEKSGRGVAILAGGTREILDAHPQTMTLTLKNRKGFARMALRHGASLVPIISFGLNDLYDTWKVPETHWFRKLQLESYRRFRGAFGYFMGRGIFQYSFGILPHRKPIHLIVGSPIHVKRSGPEPEQDQIDQLHEKYIQELTKLYNQHKNFYGYKNVPLIIN